MKLGGKTLVKGTDYTLAYSNNVNAGTAKVTIKGKGNFSGTDTRSFIVARASVAQAKITGIRSLTYTGKALKQKPKIRVSGRTLKAGTDYKVTYSNNKNAGKAKITITGEGNYSGKVSKAFTIKKASVANAKVTGLKAKTYNGKRQTQKPTVKVAGRALKLGRDYNVSYKENISAGTAKIVFKGKGSYCSSLTKTFRIYPASIGSASVSAIGDQTYTGGAVTPSVSVSVGGKALRRGTDYTLSYWNNTSPGTAYVDIYGAGNYKGSKTVSFRIVKPAAKAAAASTNGGGGEVYITNTGAKFHRESCRWLYASKIPISRSDAVARGYEPCKVCNP